MPEIRTKREGKSAAGTRSGRVLDTAVILLFFLGTVLTPVQVRSSVLHKLFPSGGYLCYLNFPCTLALLLSFIRLKRWEKADWAVFAAWLLSLVLMLVSNRGLEATRYITIPCQNLLPVYFILFRMNRDTRQGSVRLFMILFNSFILVLLAFAVEEKITGGAVMNAFTEWLVSHGMYASEFQRMAGETRTYTFWGHPLTNTLLFNGFLALNIAWYRSRGKKIYALMYVPAAAAGVLLGGSKMGIVVFLLLVAVLCWEHKKWFLACIPVLAVLYFAGALNTIIGRFTGTTLTTDRAEGLARYFDVWYQAWPFRWLAGYGSGVALDPNHPLYDCRQGFEFSLLMFAIDYGIVFALLVMIGSWGYITWRCLRKKQWTVWLCWSLVFAELNTYNGFALRNQDVFIIGCFLAMVMLNMLPDTGEAAEAAG